MSMVASTGSPSQPRVRMSFAARTDWSNRIFWLTASTIPASGSEHDHLALRATRKSQGLLRQNPRQPAAAEFDRPADQAGLYIGWHGHVEDFDLRVGQQVIDGVMNIRIRREARQRLAASSTWREAIATGLKPAIR